jgi:hexosaminidase
MSRLLLLITGVVLSLTASALSLAASANTTSLPLMPYPQEVAQHQGQLLLGKQWMLAIEGKKSPELNAALKRFSQRAAQQTGIKIRWKKAAADKATLVIAIKDSASMSHRISDWDESYELVVGNKNILLNANQHLGALRGLETLLQLIGATEQSIQLPQVNISDFPRFQWRGLLLDSSRHFFSVDTIKRQLDAMAAAKYNIFHWHLTDDQGWRFESKRYPKLQQLAADGQFYTRAQMREIVAYAQARGIQVLPEIDVPGHASAIAVAYPELMSAPGPYAMEYRWGVHKPTLNPANEKVYEFVDALVVEVKEIFPFEYLHIGGDEVDPEHWKNNADIQAFMQANDIKNTLALQAHFNQRVQTILQKHQRKMIGWDEIQHKNLPKDIVIQSWRGPDAVSESVAAGFQAILSTGYYLDQPQSAAYHYRNDPLPPIPYINPQLDLLEKSNAHKSLTSWSFSMPRKRGSPVTGSFTLINNHAGKPQGFIDFSGKSRREVAVTMATEDAAVFSLDTWMGPVEFRVNFVGDDLQGRAIVGNAPYMLSGKKDAPKLTAQIQKMTPLSAQEHKLILGGEAALWAEIVDEQSIDLRLWPRAFVVAERLWSAQKLQDESSMYLRMNAIANWAEKSTGLLHRRQTEQALQQLFGSKDIQPALLFIEMLEPAHYYHRQHEKSANESYSKADPLNRLVDALPAENEALRQFNLQLTRWLINPVEGKDYQELRAQLQRWSATREGLTSLLVAQPSLGGFVEKTYQLVDLTLSLLDKRLHNAVPSQNEKKALEKQLSNSLQIEQEMIIALVFSTENLLNSFTSP